jgi:hypothetical protein
MSLRFEGNLAFDCMHDTPKEVIEVLAYHTRSNAGSKPRGRR